MDDLKTRLHPISDPQHQQFQFPHDTSASSENVQPSALETEHRTQPAPSSSAPRHSILPTIYRKLLPAIFMMLFFIAGTIILIYSLVLHLPIPRTTVVVVTIIFGVIIVLFLVTFLFYFLEQRKRHSLDDVENYAKPKVFSVKRRWERFKKWISRYEMPKIVNIKRRWESFKEWISNYKKPNLSFGRFYNKDTEETFTKRVRQRWDIWITVHSNLRGWCFGRFWGRWRGDNTTNSSHSSMRGRPGETESFKVYSIYVGGERFEINSKGERVAPETPIKDHKSRLERLMDVFLKGIKKLRRSEPQADTSHLDSGSLSKENKTSSWTRLARIVRRAVFWREMK